jgi:putative tricarboxylic transport membrane protein
VVGVFLILLGGGITCGSFSWKYKTSLGPGPAFFPFWIGLIIATMGALMGAINTVSLIRGQGRAQRVPSELLFKATELKNVAVTTGALVASVLFLKWLGFVVTIGLFSLFLLQIVGKWGWLKSILLSVITSVGLFWIFKVWLYIPLPLGLVGLFWRR